MSTMVRFKDCEEIPCPLRTPTKVELDIWATVRGKPVRIGKSFSSAEIERQGTKHCGSDTYWEVEDEKVVSERNDVAVSQGYSAQYKPTVCRHMLEMGD